MTHVCVHAYGVATISRPLKIIGFFCRISTFFQVSFAKETYNFKESNIRSHPICVHTLWHILSWCMYVYTVCMCMHSVYTYIRTHPVY